jgi:MYXO-CTERM domain-containing protein
LRIVLESCIPGSMGCRCANRVWALFVLGLVLQVADVALADEIQQLAQVAMAPTDPQFMVVRYTGVHDDGMFITRDGGRSWGLLCDQVLFDPVTTHSGQMLITGDGSMIMGVFTGIWHDDRRGCVWASEPAYDGMWVAAVALDPLDPSITYAVTSTMPGSGKTSGLLRRDTNGAWSDLGTRDDVFIGSPGLRVVPHAGGLRFYLGAERDPVTTDAGTAQRIYAIRVSDDNGATWQEHVYGAIDGELRLEGVDPRNADRIVIAIHRYGTESEAQANDEVQVSSDQGATFAPYLQVFEIGGVAFAPDGRIWIGDRGSIWSATGAHGLWFAPSLDQPATKLPMADYPVQCLSYEKANDTLYACQHPSFGSVDPQTGAFTSMMQMGQIAGFIGCSGVDIAATCKKQLCYSYCGLGGFFAQAPVCDAYDDTLSCGREGLAPGSADAGTAGTADDIRGTGGMGGSGAGTSPGGDLGSAVSGSGGSGAPMKKTPMKKSGCSCSTTLGAHGSSASWLETLGLLALAAWSRRRARKPARLQRCSPCRSNAAPGGPRAGAVCAPGRVRARLPSS